jgi:hypothetical protein
VQNSAIFPTLELLINPIDGGTYPRTLCSIIHEHFVPKTAIFTNTLFDTPVVLFLLFISRSKGSLSVDNVHIFICSVMMVQLILWRKVMNSTTKPKTGKGTGTAAMTGDKTKSKTKNKSVSSTSVLELYQEHHTAKKTHGQFLSTLQRVGSYSSKEQAQDRLNRLSHYVSKKHGVRLDPLRSAPRLTHSTGSLLASFKCLEEK